MKNLVMILVISSLFLSTIQAGAFLEINDSKIELRKCSETMIFSEPEIKEGKNNCLFIDLKEANANLKNPNEPILPIFVKKYIFPLGTEIKNIRVTFDDIKKYKLTKKVASAPYPVAGVNHVATMNMKDREKQNIYSNNELYPREQYEYSIHVGLKGESHIVILIFECYPVQYSPMEDLIYSAGKINIDIIYLPPKKPVLFQDKYDLVIIAPEKFSTDLQPLIEHKNNFGIRTTFKTTESIYKEYSGRDQSEKIKYFIKDAIENYGIKYVLLVGGKKSLLTGNWGIEGPRLPNEGLWYVPVRYNTLLDSTGEGGCLTDLYFADIYKYEDGQPVFDDWDSDGNNVFAEWTLDAKDTLDLYPDVYVGRLACRNNIEVKIMVEKIITYEEEGCDSSWFKKIVGVGGDSFDDRPPLGDDYYEGEERNKLAFEYLNGFTPVKIWASNQGGGGLVPSSKDIIKTINEGCGFLYFAGHGNPTLYDTHWFHDYSWNNTPGGLDIYDMLLLRNGEKLPICVIGACHNSEFNVSFFNFLKSPLEYVPTPECWSWTLTRKIGGGAIATIGYTGLEWVATYGWDDDNIPDCTQYYSGYIDSRFFHACGVDGVEFLGEAWGQAITEYLDKFPEMKNKWDCKTPQQWLLLGDPSLKIGGYSSSQDTKKVKVKICNDEDYLKGYPNELVQLKACAYNGKKPYTYTWDLDNDGVYDDATGETIEWKWSNSGVYWVSVKTRDANNNEDSYKTIVSVDIKPNKPDGPCSGKKGVEYTYIVKGIDDTSWDEIYYFFDWGDKNGNDMMGPYPSNTHVEAKHIWMNSGAYNVRVKSIMINLEKSIFKETGWSEPLTVSISKNRQKNYKFFQQFFDCFPGLSKIFQLRFF